MRYFEILLKNGSIHQSINPSIHQSINPPVRILVVEDDLDLREMVVFFVESEFDVITVQAENGEIAKKVLESDKNFQVVISDYNMPKMTGGALLQYIRNEEIPVKFILLSAVDSKSVPEFKIVTPDAIAEKPGFAEPLGNALKKFLQINSTLNNTGKHTRISIHLLFRLELIFCPLFAKLSDNKFVKVVNENEIFTLDEFERFENKDIHYLYIENENAKAIFSKLIELYKNRLKDKNITHHEKILISDEISIAIRELASTFGFSEELEQITKTGVEAALKTIASNPPLKDLLKNIDLESENYLAIHSSRLPYLANHIAKMMNWDSEVTVHKIALASLLHDSTLHHSVFLKFKNETELKLGVLQLPKEEFDNYYQHPTKAAEIVRNFKGIPPDVDVIIAQHHEKGDGSGFPNKLDHTKISPLSCLFIISHELLCFYEKSGDQFKIEDFISSQENKFSSGFFKKILIQLHSLNLD